MLTSLALMIGILLAAGQGTRMKSADSKMLFQINGEPMCFGAFKSLYELSDELCVVLGFQSEKVEVAIKEAALRYYSEAEFSKKVKFVKQDKQLGTADAVKTCFSQIKDSTFQDILVLNGDMPLIHSELLNLFLKKAKQESLDSACVSQEVQNPQGLGRIFRDHRGVFQSILEEKDASLEEKKINEINTGIYFFNKDFLLQEIELLKNENKQNEFYLTDLLGQKNFQRSNAIQVKNSIEFMGVNNLYELSVARKYAQEKLQKKLAMDKGVQFLNPASSFVEASVSFLGSCVIGPSVSISGNSVVEEGVFIEGAVKIENSKLMKNACIKWGSVIEDSEVGEASQVGPMAHLRPQSQLGKNVKIGNFVELKKTTFGDNSKASHLSYLGDAEIAENVNIGCGVISVNYDGVQKHKSIVKKNAFVGSNSQLIAPVSIGEGAYVTAATVVTKNIPADALAISRPELVIKEGYAKKLLQRFQAAKKSLQKDEV